MISRSRPPGSTQIPTTHCHWKVAAQRPCDSCERHGESGTLMLVVPPGNVGDPSSFVCRMCLAKIVAHAAVMRLAGAKI